MTNGRWELDKIVGFGSVLHHTKSQPPFMPKIFWWWLQWRCGILLYYSAYLQLKLNNTSKEVFELIFEEQELDFSAKLLYTHSCVSVSLFVCSLCLIWTKKCLGISEFINNILLFQNSPTQLMLNRWLLF